MIVYIGHYFSEEVVKQRGIPFRNSAGSRRIFALANALAENEREVEIMSPGISLWSKPGSKEYCSCRIENNENLEIFYAKTSRIPFINIIVSTFSIINRISSISNNRNLDTVIVYNFNLEFLLITLFVKLFTEAKIINNIEDVSIPKLADWKKGTESRVFQQLIFFFCMKLIARLSDCFIFPTKRFIRFLPVGKKPVIIITGCFNVKQSGSFRCDYPLRILFSGKLLFDQGIDILLQALENLEDSVSKKITVSICGDGPRADWLQKKISEGALEYISYHGFLSDSEYENLMSGSDICLVLQKPEGRYKNLKTPSKFFEYYSNGKYVIASDVGDYENLPEGSLSILNPYTAYNLSTLIKSCVYDPQKITAGRIAAYNFAMDNFQYKKVGLNIITSLSI
jgi:glycosyltransferase involved in cell wall biosynthesis